MRLVLIGGIAAAALAADIQSGSAQISFFNRQFCTIATSGQDSGEPNCSYDTWEQCRASASGTGRYCSENPFWKPPQNQQRTTRQRRQRE
jgi:hypothetical protein